MEKIGNEFFGMATYDMKCPFDVAQKIIDEFEHQGVSESFGDDLINWTMKGIGIYTEFGNEVAKAFHLIHRQGLEATNKGIPQRIVDFYKRYYKWLLDNNMDTSKADKIIEEMKANNPKMDFNFDYNIKTIGDK